MRPPYLTCSLPDVPAALDISIGQDTAVQVPHRAPAFSCETCHGMSGWQPAGFPYHDSRFPIFTRAHRGLRGTCGPRRASAASYTIFGCSNCHEHQRDEADDNHRDVPGYDYESEACHACHPAGRE